MATAHRKKKNFEKSFQKGLTNENTYDIIVSVEGVQNPPPKKNKKNIKKVLTNSILYDIIHIVSEGCTPYKL